MMGALMADPSAGQEKSPLLCCSPAFRFVEHPMVLTLERIRSQKADFQQLQLELFLPFPNPKSEDISISGASQI
jgi:hypothetical protein